MESGYFGAELRRMIKQNDFAKLGSEALGQKLLTVCLRGPFLKGKQYRPARKMAKLLIKSHIAKDEGVSNFLLAKCLVTRLLKTSKRIRLKKTGYNYKMQEYNDEIQNCFRTLKKAWKPIGYNIQFNKNKSKSKIVKNKLYLDFSKLALTLPRSFLK